MILPVNSKWLKMGKFLDTDNDQLLLLPPDLNEWVPANHLARFIDSTIDELDLSAFVRRYKLSGRMGGRAFHPSMMLKVVLYAFCNNVFSSRKMERLTQDNVGARFLAANRCPDHSSFANFRNRHLEDICEVFVQVVVLCRQMGLANLGHVAIDGSIIESKASKEKTVFASEIDQQLELAEALVKQLADEWERKDKSDDADPHVIPEELQDAKAQTKKLEQIKAALDAKKARQDALFEKRILEEQARQKQTNQEPARPSGHLDPQTVRQERKLTQQTLSELTGIDRRRLSSIETGQRPPSKAEVQMLASAFGVEPDDLNFRRKPHQAGHKQPQRPSPPKYVNKIDPDSALIGKRSGTTAKQGYNAQVAVDEQNQIIVGAFVSNEVHDRNNLSRMAESIQQNLGELPDAVTADCGYYNYWEVMKEVFDCLNLLVPPEKVSRVFQKSRSDTIQMRERLKQEDNAALYRRRSSTVEPVFGDLKWNRGFRRFLTSGLGKVTAEWNLLATTHNLMKLFRHGLRG